MSISDIAALAILGILAVVQLWWRTHAALVTYAACAGYVLATTLAPELLVRLGDSVSFLTTDTGRATLSLGLFFLPIGLTIVQFRESMSHRLFQQVIPAAAGSIFIVAFALKLLPVATEQSLLDQSQVLTQINQAASWTVLLAIGVASVELLSQHDLLKVRSLRKRRGKKAKDE